MNIKLIAQSGEIKIGCLESVTKVDEKTPAISFNGTTWDDRVRLFAMYIKFVYDLSFDVSGTIPAPESVITLLEAGYIVPS